MARILVVDDRPINRRYLVQVLALEGHRTLEAGDGAEALAAAREHRPDLVVTDIMMPGMDGFELTRRLRADPDLSATRIVFYTATYRSADAQRLAESMDVSAVLSKPSGPKAVLETVERALGPARAGIAGPRRRHTALMAPVQRSAARMFALIELALDLATERDRSAFLRMFCDGALRIVDASAAVLVLLDADREVQVVQAHGLPDDVARQLREQPLRAGLPGQVLERDGALRAGNGHTPLDGLPGFGAASFLGVPVHGAAGACGALIFTRSIDTAAFDDEDEMLGLALAAEFGVLFELFEAHEAMHRYAAELHAEVEQRRRAEIEMAGFARRLLDQEKDTTRRLAQSLHDELGQTLAAMRLTLDAWSARPDAAGERPDLRQRLQTLAADANRQVREVLVDLRPPLLDEQGLAAALDNELRQRAARVDGVTLRLECTPQAQRLRWPPEVEYAAFMIGREGLSNALRHAHAGAVWVALDGDAGRLVLAVRDNGRGLPQGGGEAEPGHLGMVSMRERAVAIGARLDVHSVPELGTVVKLHWEMPHDPAVPDR